MSAGRERALCGAGALACQLALACGIAPMSSAAATATGSVGGDLARVAPRQPGTRVRTEFVVETNALGQVTRVRSVRRSTDAPFNALTYGNALQAFIRTARGGAVPGVYRLAYAYDPRGKNVRRTVALVRSGGVDPNAPGAVTVEAAKLRHERDAAEAARAYASPLPDLKHITTHRH